jgi:hypothetical protein
VLTKDVREKVANEMHMILALTAETLREPRKGADPMVIQRKRILADKGAFTKVLECTLIGPHRTNYV